MKKQIQQLIMSLTLLVLCLSAAASPTKVGNGDDGGDLEELEKVEAGILISTRDKALKKLEKLNINGISNLGQLINEVGKSDIYLVKGDIQAPHKFDKSFETSPDGKSVYARTFARPHAATRFFPAAMMLSERQLIALHIHEGLHRSLPPHVSENESVVTEITLAIVGPDATKDLVAQKVSQLVASPQITTVNYKNSPAQSFVEEPAYTEKIKRPSEFSYKFKMFQQTEDSSIAPVLAMHSIESFLHPFGGKNEAIGLGLAFSYLTLEEKSYLGPLEISGRMRLATWRQFDVGTFFEYSMYTLSDDELLEMPLARDVAKIGLSMSKESDYFYVKNFVSLTFGSESEQLIGPIKYTHNFGETWNVNVGAGAKLGAFTLGGKADLLLVKSYSVTGEDYASHGFGRFRIVKVGPEISYVNKYLSVSIFAETVIDSTQGVSLDHLGDLFGHGAGQGYVGSSLTLTF